MTEASAPLRPSRAPPVTVGALVGLVLGIGLGATLRHEHADAAEALLPWIQPFGTLWIHLLRMTVVPLVVGHLVVALASTESRGQGRLGLLSLALFVGLLLAGAAFALALAPPALAVLAPDAATIRALESTVSTIAPAAADDSGNVLEWLVALVPVNVVTAATEDALLPLLVFTVLFALALRRVASERRALVVGFFQGVAEAMLVLVRWILWLTPLGVFALAYATASRTGLDAVGILGSWVLLVSGLLLAFTLLLYPFTALAGRIGVGRFAWGVAPAQAVAVGTRSSLASLPALLEGAHDRLRLPAHVSGFVLPLAVSTFKVNRTVSSVAKLLFLSAAYGIDLSAGQVASFVALVVLLSFSTPGLPSSGRMSALPAYLAAGVPLEGYLLLETVEVIPDIFKTLANVTADMSVAVVVRRFAG